MRKVATGRAMPIVGALGMAAIGRDPADTDPSRNGVALTESLAASGLESGSPDTAITFQALLVERQMARALSIFGMHL